jgi:hypothetical protein
LNTDQELGQQRVSPLRRIAITPSMRAKPTMVVISLTG